MNVNFMTWNTKLYEYGNKVGRQTKEIDNVLFNSIIETIDQHLEKENSIAILQEIPYTCNITWKEHELFKKFKNHYTEDDQYTAICYYDIYDYDIYPKKPIKMTVVLSKKGLIEIGEKYTKKFKNCDIALNCYIPFNIKNSDISALAIHAHNALECREYLNRDLYKHYNLILGDFNAGNYINKSDDEIIAVNRQNYLLLTEGYIDLCQGEYTTKYETYIDHILLESSFDFISRHRYSNIIVNRNITLSDHYPITFALSI